MTNISRRKFLNISAVFLASPLLSKNIEVQKITWEGIALGAKSSMTLFHYDVSYTKSVLAKCEKEILRLENIFSLYKKSSSISQLNSNGYINNPPKELLELISISNTISKQTNGVFDISIQPLWKVYSKYHSNEELLKQKVKETKKLVSYENISFNKNKIKFKQKNMSITLNGIAQGFISDRISDLLKKAGFTNVLVDLGEINAIGQHPQKRDWNISTPYLKDRKYISINNQAMASSGGYGTRFNKKYHHLINAKKAVSVDYINSVTVIAKEAVLADVLATALAVSSKKQRDKLMKIYPKVKVYLS